MRKVTSISITLNDYLPLFVRHHVLKMTHVATDMPGCDTRVSQGIFLKMAEVISSSFRNARIILVHLSHQRIPTEPVTPDYTRRWAQKIPLEFLAIIADKLVITDIAEHIGNGTFSVQHVKTCVFVEGTNNHK